MNALILVDLQNDFFPGGALAVKDGDLVLPAVNALLKLPFNLIIATKDYHSPNHISFALTHHKKEGETIEINGIPQILWPVHTVQGTNGADFAPGWDSKLVDKVILKGTDREIDSYSTFFDNGHKKSTGLENFLKENGIETVFIAGLATDYCVKYSVLDALSLGFKVKVVKEGCRGVGLKSHDIANAFDEMEAKGAKIISIDKAREEL